MKGTTEGDVKKEQRKEVKGWRWRGKVVKETGGAAKKSNKKKYGMRAEQKERWKKTRRKKKVGEVGTEERKWQVREGKVERHMQRREVSGNKDMKGKDKVMRERKVNRRRRNRTWKEMKIQIRKEEKEQHGRNGKKRYESGGITGNMGTLWVSPPRAKLSMHPSSRASLPTLFLLLLSSSCLRLSSLHLFPQLPHACRWWHVRIVAPLCLLVSFYQHTKATQASHLCVSGSLCRSCCHSCAWIPFSVWASQKRPTSGSYAPLSLLY